MITSIIIMIGVFFISLISIVAPNREWIPLDIITNFAMVGDWISGVDAFFPGIISKIMTTIYTIFAVQLTLVVIIGAKKLINFIRGTGEI